MIASVTLTYGALMQTPDHEIGTLAAQTGTEQGDERCKQLNTLNLDEFLANVERRAFSFALLSTQQQEQDALDIVQEAMLAFVRHYANKPQDEWKPLFYRVLNSKIMDFHRRQSVRNRWRLWLDSRRDEDEQQSPEDFHAAFKDPLAIRGEDFVASQQRLQVLERSLSDLPLRQRQAFLFRCWEGLSTKETAQAMSCSEGSVKTHYFRALTALRLALKELR